MPSSPLSSGGFGAGLFRLGLFRGDLAAARFAKLKKLEGFLEIDDGGCVADEMRDIVDWLGPGVRGGESEGRDGLGDR
jgi:hypothetical protein